MAPGSSSTDDAATGTSSAPDTADSIGQSSDSIGRSSDSIGRYLSRQRQLRGISLDELAQLTRIPIRSLERLEAGAFDGQADGFARGFVRTVAVAIGLDADEAVSRILKESVVESGVSLTTLGRGVVLLGALLVAIFGAIAVIDVWQRTPSVVPTSEALPVRRDAVRALALQEGQAPPVTLQPGGVPAAALLPEPAPEPAEAGSADATKTPPPAAEAP